MSDQLKLSVPRDPTVEIRHNGERRHGDRRGIDRGTRDRRKGERRKARLRGLLFSALAFIAPQQLKSHSLALLPTAKISSGPGVTTNIESLEAILPSTPTMR